jgi:CheY-like chemotaxis protein
MQHWVGVAKHVLVVEDDQDIRVVLTTCMLMAGYRVDEASHGVEALDFLQHSLPDLILLDMKMPVMDGWAFVAALRRRFAAPPPIVVLTAAHDPEQRALDVGVKGWLGKPCDVQELIGTIERVIGKAEG